MPEMIPVGNTITPPNPQQSMGLLSGVLGLQQQRQQLQTGQYQQQTAQAESQQAQQKNQEMQAAAQFVSGAARDPSYLSADGITPDIQKFTQGFLKVAPTYGQAILGQSISNFQEGVKTRQALQGLASDQNAVMVKGLQGLANLPGGATRTDLLNWKEQVESNNKDPALHRALDNLAISLQPDPNGGYSGAAAKAAATLGGLSMQEPGTQQLTGKIQPVVTTTMGPNVGQQTPVGSSVATVPGPTETPEYKGAVAAAAARATGVAGTDLDRANLISNSIQPSKAAIGLTQQIDGLADIVHSGKIAGGFSKTAAALGVTDATSARQLLEKDLGQLKTTATRYAPSDEAGRTILSGYPEATTDTPVIHSAMDYIRGSFKQNLARGEMLQVYRKNRPDPEISAAFPGSSGSYLLHPDPNVTRQSDQPVTPGTPIGDLVGKYNQWAGGQLANEAHLFGMRDPRSLQDLRSAPAAAETVLGLSGGRGRPANQPLGAPAEAAQVHPLQAAADAEQGRIDAIRTKATQQGFELSDKTGTVPQQISNRLSREDLNLPPGAPLTPNMLRQANKQYVSPPFEAMRAVPDPIPISATTKATIEDVADRRYHERSTGG